MIKKILLRGTIFLRQFLYSQTREEQPLITKVNSSNNIRWNPFLTSREGNIEEFLEECLKAPEINLNDIQWIS